MMLWRAAALMATTFCMTLSPSRLDSGASLGKLLMRQGFGTSARKPKNGFIAGENCFVAGPATKHSRQKCEQFQIAEICRRARFGPAGALGRPDFDLLLEKIRPFRRPARTDIRRRGWCG